MISKDDLVKVLRECGTLTDDPPDGEAIVLDSLTLVWLVHLLDEQYGIVVGPEDEEELAGCPSVDALHRRLLRTVPEEAVHDA